jgi:Nucleotidyltransferase domain
LLLPPSTNPNSNDIDDPTAIPVFSTKGLTSNFRRPHFAINTPAAAVSNGSHAYGTPHADSDVDILVIMPARNQLDQASKIRMAVPAPFAMDLIVRTPKNLQWRLAEGESLHTELLTKGKVQYEKANAGMDAQMSRAKPPRREVGVTPLRRTGTPEIPLRLRGFAEIE